MSSADLDFLDRNSGKETGLNRDYYAGITQGRIEERERIIKVIEELRIINSDHKFFVIRAIKGEQK